MPYGGMCALWRYVCVEVCVPYGGMCAHIEVGLGSPGPLGWQIDFLTTALACQNGFQPAEIPVRLRKIDTSWGCKRHTSLRHPLTPHITATSPHATHHCDIPLTPHITATSPHVWLCSRAVSRRQLAGDSMRKHTAPDERGEHGSAREMREVNMAVLESFAD